MLRTRLNFIFRWTGLVALLLTSLTLSASPFTGEDDGYRLWLKYDRVADSKQLKQYRNQVSHWRVEGDSPTFDVIRHELDLGLNGLLGATEEGKGRLANGELLVGTPASSKKIAGANLKDLLAHAGSEGYVISTVKIDGKNITVITGNNDIGVMHGVFHFLRLLQTRENIDDLNIVSAPQVQVRVLNHWDNLDRHVERGYAGSSIWDWHKLPEYKYQRYYDYARANASIGINGTVLNNVNADALILTPRYLEKVAALAEIFRPYGIKVYLSIKFSSPNLIGGLETSDPLDPRVRQWWKDKTKEIYARIPDFGGFLVKANSEGQPGPQDFGRTHADGANMLAEALEPHGGIVMWRAFVYQDNPEVERSLQAYNEFKPLDGKFKNNVLVQVKNGPIDFQPREPITALFGATPETPLMMEFQITMEYLGFSTHFVYLGTMYEEVLDTDTYAKGEGSTVAKIIDGSLFNYPVTGMAGVSNIGTDRNWTGHIMLQSNWYVFGRLAWDNNLSAGQIADEWIRMTLSNDNKVVKKVNTMMMASRENTVNYMTPLGLHHIMDTGHHYGPGPWIGDLGRADWNPVYYHNADSEGIGFDRTESGTNAISQYFPPLREKYSSPETTPEEFLLWFHHLPWDYQMKSGKTLWEEIVLHYYAGAEAVEQMAKEWDALEGKIDQNQFLQVQMAMDIQVKEARWWRNACVLYFQSFSKRPIPAGLEKPEGTLEEYMKMEFPYAPGRG